MVKVLEANFNILKNSAVLFAFVHNLDFKHRQTIPEGCGLKALKVVVRPQKKFLINNLLDISGLYGSG